MSEDRWLNQFCKWENAERPTHAGPCVPPGPPPDVEYCLLLLETGDFLKTEHFGNLELQPCP